MSNFFNFSFKNRIAFNYIVSTALLISIVFLVIFQIVKFSVYDHINDNIEVEVKKLKKLKQREEYQERDLEDCLIHLDALKRTRYYYGGVKYLPK